MTQQPYKNALFEKEDELYRVPLKNMRTYHTALTIAGSDCSAGAGIQADLKTFAALGCYGMSVITALTAQNTQGVQGIYPVDPDFICQQFTSILSDIPIGAIKIGMLHNAQIISALSNKLKHLANIPIVIDPVMVAKDGSPLLEKSDLAALKTQLFPLAYLITPNIPEAELLLGYSISNRNEMQKAAGELAEFSSKAVLLKGGHLPDEDESTDCLYLADTHSYHWFARKKINTRNTHGTGCTLSAAITAFLAQDYDLVTAVKQAKDYLSAAIAAGSAYQLGQGMGPVQHFYQWWER
jgi:hydroxymethylpyrimidine/phosphomethylpyrimidine kinase